MLIAHGSMGLLLVAGLLLTGCSSAASTNPDDYVGEYVFMPANSDPGESASFMVLRRDRTAVEVHVIRATGELVTTKEKWRLYHGEEEDVLLGNSSHPIHGSPTDIKLEINDDLGQYYQKVR